MWSALLLTASVGTVPKYQFLCHGSVFVCSPERSPREILLDLDSSHNIFKDKVPKAKEEMEDKLKVCGWEGRKGGGNGGGRWRDY
jgi:hypothetical protein